MVSSHAVKNRRGLVWLIEYTKLVLLHYWPTV